MRKLFFLFLLVDPAGGSAQDSTYTQSSLIIEKLSTHIYSGAMAGKSQLLLDTDVAYLYFIHPHLSTFRGGSFPDLKLRYGLAEFIEVGIGTRIGYFHADILEDIEYYDQHPNKLFIDFLSLGAKVRLLNYNKSKGNLIAAVESYPPYLRTTNFGPSILPTLSFINNNQIINWLGFTLNLGATYNQWNLSPYRINIGAAAILYLPENINCIIGMSSFFYPDTGNTYTPNFIGDGIQGYFSNIGITYSPAPSIQLRTAITIDNENNFFLYGLNCEAMLGMAWKLK